MSLRTTLAGTFVSAALIGLVHGSAAGQAQPQPVPGTNGLVRYAVANTSDRRFELFLFGGTNTGATDPLPPGTDIDVEFKPLPAPWNMDLRIVLRVDTTGADQVLIEPKVFHNRHPNPEPPGGRGTVYDTSIQFDLVQPRIIGVRTAEDQTRRADKRYVHHEKHRDLYTAAIPPDRVGQPAFIIRNNNQLRFWSAVITGEHEPQPKTGNRIEETIRIPPPPDQ